MNKFKKIIAAPHFSTGALVLAAVLLLFSSVGGIRAALVEQSNYYEGQVDLSSIGVTLVETNAKYKDGHDVASRDYDEGYNASEDDYINWQGNASGELLDGMLYDEDTEKDEQLKLGKAYKEELRVRNSGSIHEYVRVSVYKYWLNEDGETKDRSLDPGLINLKFETGKGWTIHEGSSTKERTVLYYSSKLAPDPEGKGQGEVSAPFTSTLSIDNKVGAIVRKEYSEPYEKDGVTYQDFKTYYAFDGKQFCVEAIVDAVQDHNAADAIKSAWGVDAGAVGISL